MYVCAGKVKHTIAAVLAYKESFPHIFSHIIELLIFLSAHLLLRHENTKLETKLSLVRSQLITIRYTIRLRALQSKM